MFSSNTSQVSNDAVFVEDVFSTWLYTGNGSTQTINNGIDLSGKGGLVWIKNRGAAQSHGLSDTARGAGNWMSSDLTVGNIANNNGGVSAFTSSGFSVNTSDQQVNGNGNTYTSWTFRKQPKFFDVVTYTGDGTYRQIAHSLGSVPGFIIVKRTDSTSNWQCYHRSLGNNQLIRLNFTDAAISSVGTSGAWGETDPTTTNFTVGSGTACNVNGATYVAYLFAHNAGGFGLTGTDNVISCGSFTTDGSGNATIDLGYEPQWVLVKQSNSDGTNWQLIDTMRGFTASNSFQRLFPNSSAAEGGNTGYSLNATGFSAVGNNASGTFIYIAIRRGPMRTPTSGTSVYTASSGNGTSIPGFTAGFPIDMAIIRRNAADAGGDTRSGSRLVGSYYLSTYNTDAEVLANDYKWDWQTSWYNTRASDTAPTYSWMFRRAPGFFDEVCYTGTGSARTVAHNLGVAPELMIVKDRSVGGYAWSVYVAPLGNTKALALNTASAADTWSAYWNNTSPTSSAFTVGTLDNVNGPGFNLVAYLFASCPGVSKVGSYTGNGSSQTINCGFTGGARFVLIKRTNSTGDWYVWDTARGIVSGNDPHLSLNTTAAEVTSNDTIDPDSTGFIVNQVSATNVNVNGATYIYLAIA